MLGAFDAVIAQMSTWESDSLVSRYNRAAAGSVHALPRRIRTGARLRAALGQGQRWRDRPDGGAAGRPVGLRRGCAGAACATLA